MEQWVAATGTRVVVVFEGRDAAGKGGAIKRMTEHMNPRITKHVALPVPTERQKTQWYFQRYVNELPAAGEIILFDRSWYNRAGIEHVLGFCTPEEYYRFLRQCPVFERQLVEDGIILIKYWFSVSDEEQERRFEARVDDPMRRWKLSSTDLYSRTKWVDYSRAKDEMFVHTDIPEARWNVVEADIKKKARLNCIAHLLSQIPWEPKPLPADRHPAASGGRRVRPSAAGPLHLRARPRRGGPGGAKGASDEVVERVQHGLADARDERDLLLREQARLRRRAGVRMQSTSWSASSASNARIHSQSPSPNALVVFAEDVGELAADPAVVAQQLARAPPPAAGTTRACARTGTRRGRSSAARPSRTRGRDRA